ncbi:hypothetical protein TIFTF001_029843 [Ficus carica]|uniref:Uncharacterized protein n=1 Tax=Ficus carica TaxID=3494 RepID=A0AA88DS62_FICCA|nr:hypothetical protein TIFTF001_029843 [Ficus carica]
MAEQWRHSIGPERDRSRRVQKFPTREAVSEAAERIEPVQASTDARRRIALSLERWLELTRRWWRTAELATAPVIDWAGVGALENAVFLAKLSITWTSMRCRSRTNLVEQILSVLAHISRSATNLVLR